MSELDRYALRVQEHGRLTGVGVAMHAIRDGFFLMHVGVGCKRKASDPLLAHDWAEPAAFGWTEVEDRDLVLGAVERLGPYLRSWVERRRPAFVAVSCATFLEMTGEEIEGAVHLAAAHLPCEVELIPASGYDGDLYEGYGSVLEAVCRRIPWSVTTPSPGRAALLGHWFDRYEGDHNGNLMQLKMMLADLGIELVCALFSGDTYGGYQRAAEAGLLIELPYAQPASLDLGGRSTLVTDLPIGITGTSRWLRQVGLAAGASASAIDAFIAKRAQRARRPLEPFIDSWQGHSVAVFAEAPLAAGLCSALLDFGLEPVLVGLRGSSLGSPESVRATLARLGQSLQPGVEILDNPTVLETRQRLTVLAANGRLDLLLGSSVEMNIIRRIPPSAHQVARGATRSGPRLVEIGFPCATYHVVQQAPLMGYAGAVGLAQRLINAPHLHEGEVHPL